MEKLTSERQWAFRSLLVQVETRQMSTIETRLCPVSIFYTCLVSTADICPVSAADICPVSTCTSKDRKARWRALVNFSMQDCTKREAASWKLSAAFFWWFLVILNVFVCNMLLQNACKNHQKYVRQLTTMVPKWSQNLSKIDPGGALEATWEPPLKQGASKTSFLTILAPF